MPFNDVHHRNEDQAGITHPSDQRQSEELSQLFH